MTLNALIVDDEEYSRKSLYFFLQEHCADVQVGGIARSAAEARELIAEEQFDLAFLDIAMPRESGFDLLPELQKRNVAVIFTTAYDQYALQALKASAVDYLLKPIDIDELKTAVRKASDWLTLRNKSRLETTSGTTAPEGTGIAAATGKSLKITVPNVHGFNIIDTADIIYIEADSNYSILHLRNDEKVVISKPLKDFEELLDSSDFARPHKSTIVNFNYVKSFSHKNGVQILLHNGTVLPVSRRRSNEFQERVKAYFKG